MSRTAVYHGLGVEWASTLLAALMALLAPVPFIFMKCAPSVRPPASADLVAAGTALAYAPSRITQATPNRPHYACSFIPSIASHRICNHKSVLRDPPRRVLLKSTCIPLAPTSFSSALYLAAIVDGMLPVLSGSSSSFETFQASAVPTS